MEKPEFIIVPPMARIPQIPPQQVAGNRRVYISPAINPLSASQYLPASPPHTPEPRGYFHMAPTLTRIPVPQQQHAPTGFQAGRRSWKDDILGTPPYPRLGAAAPKNPAARVYPIKGMSRNVYSGTSHAREIPDTPPYALPEYFPVRANRQEPGVGETLMGCVFLLATSVIVLVLLFYLAS